MKTIIRPVAMLAVATVGLATRPAEAQVSVGIATPGFAMGVGPGAGFVGVGGVYPGYYPPVVAAPIYAPRPIYAPPIYARPYPAYGYGYGYGYGRPYPPGPRYGYPVRHYR